MTEETTTPDPQDTPEQEETDPVAEREAKLAEKEANLAKFEKELNKRSTELGLTAKQLAEAQVAAQAATADPDDGEFTSDQIAQAAKLLKAVFGVDPATIATTVQSQAERAAAEFKATGDEFFDSHPEIDSTEFFAFLGDLGVAEPKTPVDFKRMLKKGYEVYTKYKADPAKLAEEALAGKVGKGEEVVEVRPKRTGVSPGKQTVDEVLADPTKSFFEKMAIAEQLED